MIRGTTPHYTLTIKGYDLTQMSVYVTIRRCDYPVVTLTNDRLTISYDDDTTSIEFSLSQDETLLFEPGNCKIQVRFINSDGDAQATEIGDICVGPILQDGKISYEGA